MRGDFFFLNVVLSERLCLRNWGVRDGKPKRTRLLWMREVIKRTAWASGCHFAGRFHSLSCTCAVYAAAREAHILSMPPCGTACGGSSSITMTSSFGMKVLSVKVGGFVFRPGCNEPNTVIRGSQLASAPHVHVDDSANDAPTTTTRH